MDAGGRRLEVLERVRRIQSELYSCRATLHTLRESAWPEEKCPSDGPLVQRLCPAEANSDAFKRLVKSIGEAKGAGLDGEANVRSLAEAGRLLVASFPAAPSEATGAESPAYCGCCVLSAAATAGAAQRPSRSACEAPTGEVRLLFVEQGSRRRGVGRCLLQAAEERLAAEFQCGHVRVTLPDRRDAGDASVNDARAFLGKLGYTPCPKDASARIKTLPMGFISRALARKVAAQEAELASELTSALEEEEKAAAAAAAASVPKASGEDSSVPMEGVVPAAVATASSGLSAIVCLPHDVWDAVARCFGIREASSMAATCQLFGQELRDVELWRSLFLGSSWPPSSALLEFAAGTASSLDGGMDWRDQLRQRAGASPAIVVDVGRGYTKYGIVHGVRGRPEGDGVPPRLVQLCSSPTHPPDCQRGEQFPFIHNEIDEQLLRAFTDPDHPLHAVSLGDPGKPVSSRLALVRGCPRRPDLEGATVLVHSKDADGSNCVVTVVKEGPDAWRRERAFSGCSSAGGGNPAEPGACAQDEADDGWNADQEGTPPQTPGARSSGGGSGGSLFRPPPRSSASQGTAEASPKKQPDRRFRFFPLGRGRLRSEDEESVQSSASRSSASPRRISVESYALVPLRRASELPLMIGEPFAVTADGPSAVNWRLSTKAQLGIRPAPVRFVPQAQMALWAHGIDHGIVVNIGQQSMTAIPVVQGAIIASASCSSDNGSASLTQMMVRLLSNKFSIIDSRLMTWCRDLKEEHCYAYLPQSSRCSRDSSLWQRFRGGEELGIESVRVQVPHSSIAIHIDQERVLVPEALFDASIIGGPTLPGLIVHCAERTLQTGVCEGEALRALLRNIVLVGGAADIPGMRPRTEYEVRRLLAMASPRLQQALASPDDAFVLNPPLSDTSHRPLTSPRFAPFFGGCVRVTIFSQAVAPDELGTEGVSAGEGGEEEGGAGGASGRRRLRQRLGGPAMAAWVRRQLFGLNAPAIFRAGGGGGEEDQVLLRYLATARDIFEEEDSDEDMEDFGGQGYTGQGYRQHDQADADMDDEDIDSSSSSVKDEDEEEEQPEDGDAEPDVE